MNPILQNLMRNLMNKNPQGYQLVNQLMNSNGNPEGALKQLFGNATPEQRQQVLNQARGYGVPNEVLSRLQNMK